MALKRKTIRGQLSNTSAVLLAASASFSRYVRSLHIANNTAAARTVSIQFAATVTSAGPGIFQEALPANTAGATSRADRYYPGTGHRLDNVAISGSADAAGTVSYEIIYDESDVVDAS